MYTKSITSVDILTSFKSTCKCRRSIRFHSDVKLLCSVNQFLFATILCYNGVFDKKKVTGGKYLWHGYVEIMKK